MSSLPIEHKPLNLEHLHLESFYDAFDRLDPERMMYTLAALSDLGEEMASAEPAEIQQSMTSLLRILMGTVLCTKAAILNYAKFKYALQSVVSKGFKGGNNVYLRLEPKELAKWMAIKQPLRLEELAEVLPGFYQTHGESLAKLGVRLLVPLVLKNSLAGCLLIGNKLDKKPYSPGDFILLSLMGRLLSVALNKYTLMDELKQTSDKLRKQKAELVEANLGVQKMSEISMRFISILDENKLFHAIMDEMLSSTSASKGVILQVDYQRDALRVMCCKNTEPFGQQELLPYRSYEALAKTVDSGEAHICMLEGERIWQVEAKYALFVPIKEKQIEDTNQVSYILAVFDKEKRGGGHLTFNERDEAILVSFANYASILIENVRNYELATKDGLTNLYVRRYFDQRLAEQIEKSTQYNKVFSVLILDIDHFKQVNDTFGHGIGDQAIKLVAATIQRNIRTEIDVPTRYGGEEFTILMPEADQEKALMVAERIRQAIDTTDVSHLVTGRNITVSVGIAVFPNHGTHPRELMEAADIALYKSKGGGRNRVSLFEEDEL